MTDDDIKRLLSGRRVHKFGPIPGDKEAWLRQMDEVARDAGLPNVYRTGLGLKPLEAA